MGFNSGFKGLNVLVQLNVIGCCFFCVLCIVITICVNLSFFGLKLAPLDVKPVGRPNA